MAPSGVDRPLTSGSTPLLAEIVSNIQTLLGWLLCPLGFHDFRIVKVTFGFGTRGSVEEIQCRRCGLITMRQT